MERVGVENVQENFCGEIKGVKQIFKGYQDYLKVILG